MLRGAEGEYCAMAAKVSVWWVFFSLCLHACVYEGVC